MIIPINNRLLIHPEGGIDLEIVKNVSYWSSIILSLSLIAVQAINYHFHLLHSAVRCTMVNRSRRNRNMGEGSGMCEEGAWAWGECG
jgi:hypothetical protein